MRSILAVTTIIETALNKLLFSAANSDHQIKSARYRLTGKILRLNIKELSQPVTLVFSQRQVDALGNWGGDVHCTVTAPLSVFLKLRSNQNIPALIRTRQLDVEGDMKVLQQLVTLIELVNWDPADTLAPYIGDIAAYSVSHNLHCTASLLKHAFDKNDANFRQAVKEEWLMLPNPLELADLSDRIAELANEVDAISNRVEKLNTHDDSR